MRIALIHDYLNQLGGGERVLEELLRLFPTADLVTLFHDAELTDGRFVHRLMRTSFLNHKFVARRHRLFIPVMPFAASRINLHDTYDLIISDTAGYAKGVAYDTRGGKSFHLSYCYTPIRYAWEASSYFKNFLLIAAGAPAFAYLRNWDRHTAQHPRVMLTLSRHMQKKIAEYYGRKAEIVYPPIRTDRFFYDPAVPQGDYYLAAGRLLHYKKFDLVIEACAEAGRPLVIAGTGPELQKLKGKSQKVKGGVSFLEYVKDDNELRKLYAGARALIFPQEEDFGLVAAEAIACGTPVIAFRGGGALDIVEEGTSGHFFDAHTPDAVTVAIHEYEAMSFDRPALAKTALRFSPDGFKEGLRANLPAELQSLLA